MNLQKNKKRKYWYSLFVQVYIAFGMVLTLFALVTGVIYLRLYENNIVATYRKSLKAQAEQVAKKMQDFVIAKDTDGGIDYMEYLDSLENNEETDIWFIENEDSEYKIDKEFTNADISDIDLAKGTRQVIDKAKKGKIAYSSGYDGIYQKTMMCVAAPIYNSGGEVVEIVLLNSFVEERDNLISTSKMYIVYSILAGILLSLIVSLVLAKVITKPITLMQKTALELAEGHYEKRTNYKGKNEIGILASSMDILAEKLEENEAERSQTEQMRLDFFANVSHELRTPITVVRGYAETLADGIVSKEEKKQQYYKRIVGECQSMERLVGDLLTLSKVQNPHFKIEKEPVNLVQIFEDILRNYKQTAEKKNIELHFSCDEEWIMMFGDYDRLRQLFQNIVDNALKFSHEGGNVWITLMEEEEIRIVIQDEGIGIKEEELPYIFEKFYKSKLRQNAKGSGLGLVIAKYIVEKHNGKVEVDSVEGQGTTFTFVFQKVKGNLEEIIKKEV